MIQFEINGDIQGINEFILLNAFINEGFKQYKYFANDYFILRNDIDELRISHYKEDYLFRYSINSSNKKDAIDIAEYLKDFFEKIGVFYIIELIMKTERSEDEILSFRKWK